MPVHSKTEVQGEPPRRSGVEPGVYDRVRCACSIQSCEALLALSRSVAGHSDFEGPALKRAKYFGEYFGTYRRTSDLLPIFGTARRIVSQTNAVIATDCAAGVLERCMPFPACVANHRHHG
jgi:hypothetical protein